jgi:hypothetical protein
MWSSSALEHEKIGSRRGREDAGHRPCGGAGGWEDEGDGLADGEVAGGMLLNLRKAG